MSVSDFLAGPETGPKSGGPPTELVVCLHGLGADGNDLIALADPLGDILANAVFLAPDAPFPCDMAPVGRQWFSLQNMSPEAIYAGLEQVAPRVDRYLDQCLSRFGVPPERCALLGFSQGTMLALHLALRRPDPLGCVVGFSGALVMPDALPAEHTSRPPTLLVHGTDDEIIPFEAMAAASEGLAQIGTPTHCLSRAGLGHGIDGEGLKAAAAFLRAHLQAVAT